MKQSEAEELNMEKHLLKVSVLLGNIKAEEHTEDRHGRGGGCRRSSTVFTGKLVKSLLIDGNPALRRFFEKTAGAAPKLVHVTPLYVESSKVRCVHYFGDVTGNIRYAFYVGFIEADNYDSPRFDDVYRALVNVNGRHRFRDSHLDVELLSVESIDVNRASERVVSDLLRTGKVRVVFASPTLLRDPFRRGKHKSLVPTPMNIFSTPVYVNLYLSGRLRQRLFIKALLVLHRLLNEPHSAFRTTRIIKVKYDDGKNPIPALIGYVNLYLNRSYHEHYATKGLSVESLLRETLTTMLTVGTGTSRATGFGHITFTTPSGSSAGTMEFPETKRWIYKPTRRNQLQEAIKKD